VSTPPKPFKGQKIKDTSAVEIFKKVKTLILGNVKMNFVDQSIDKLDKGSTGSLNIDRTKASGFEETGKVDHQGEYTIFG